MPRQAPELSIALAARRPGTTIARWLYSELRAAILDGRLPRGARLPPTRELAVRYRISRGVVVGAFELLREEGYITSRVGAGTTVRLEVAEDLLAKRIGPPRLARRQPPAPRTRPFCPIEPALAEFPMATWARLTAHELARVTPRSLARGAPGGSRRLRESVAAYLGASRGVACSPDQVVIVSGVQQGLDLIARLVVRAGDPVWIEDPGYSGGVAAFRNAGATLVPVRVDSDGLDPADGLRQCARPAAVYLTPAHQFPLGGALSLDRRVELLRLAAATGAVIVEDDYDSEFRYRGSPLPALKGLRGGEPVFLLGTFNKALFPALRLGYMIVPDRWIDRVLALRYDADLYPPALTEAVLAAFIEGGHFARHLRRMRELYGSRHEALRREIARTIGDLVRLQPIEAGFSTPAYLARSTSLRAVVEHAANAGVELWRLDRFALRRRDLHGLMLGFAAFTERQIRDGVDVLARAIEAA